MFKDLEKRGVKPNRSEDNPTNSEEFNAAFNEEIEEMAAADSTTEEEVAAKKGPSRILVYSVLGLLIYLSAYIWLTVINGKALNQVINPLQANQYQPKAVTPLHQQNHTQVDAQMTASGNITDEIKAAIETEIQQSHADNGQSIEEMLSEAEELRQAEISKAIKGTIDAQTEKLATSDKTDVIEDPAVTAIQEATASTTVKPQPLKTKVKPVVKKVAKVQKPKVAKTVSKPEPAKQKLVQVKKHAATKTAMVETITKPAKAQPAARKPILAKAKPHTVKQNTVKHKPKIVKTIRSEHQAEQVYQKALKYVQQGRVSEAQALLAKTLDIDPAHQDARQTLAALLLDNQRIKAAKEVLQDGLVVSPNHVPFRMAVARLEVELGDQGHALETLLEGKKQALNNAPYQAFLASLLQEQNRHEEAITHFKNALNIDRGTPNVFIGLGISLQSLNRLDDAKIAYQKAQNNTRLPNDLRDFIGYRLKEVEERLSTR